MGSHQSSNQSFQYFYTRTCYVRQNSIASKEDNTNWMDLHCINGSCPFTSNNTSPKSNTVHSRRNSDLQSLHATPLFKTTVKLWTNKVCVPALIFHCFISVQYLPFISFTTGIPSQSYFPLYNRCNREFHFLVFLSRDSSQTDPHRKAFNLSYLCGIYSFDGFKLTCRTTSP